MSFFENTADFFSKIPSINFRVTDILDICLVAFLIYNGIKLIRDTRAFQLVKGLLLLGVGYFVINALNMEASSYIFEFIFKNIFIILVILFRQEIRHVLEKVGTSKLSNLSHFLKGGSSEKYKVVNEAIIEISKAVQRMSDSKTGSLIVMEKEFLLGDVIETGKEVDAKITHELVGNIFFPNSPLHDGAAIVRDGRLLCAGCVLPLSKNSELSSDLGTRHRAALGMSEQSDAMVIVTSEETGTISVAVEGELIRNLSEAELREELIDYILDDVDTEASSADGGLFTKLFKGKKK